jgi:hypothetical protein
LLRAYIEANRLQEAKRLLDVRRPGASEVQSWGLPRCIDQGVLRSSAPELYVLSDEKELLDRNGGSRYPRRFGSVMTPLSGPFPVAFSRVADPASLSARETPNLLAKYRVTTGAVAIIRG